MADDLHLANFPFDKMKPKLRSPINGPPVIVGTMNGIPFNDVRTVGRSRKAAKIIEVLRIMRWPRSVERSLY